MSSFGLKQHGDKFINKIVGDFICPAHKGRLSIKDEFFQCAQGCRYPLQLSEGQLIIDFSDQVLNENKDLNEKLYQGPEQNDYYRNFLDWLFLTFKTKEERFRKSLLNKCNFHDGAKVLVTGCGNGDDVLVLAKNYKSYSLDIHAQDISREMVAYTGNALSKNGLTNMTLSISDATNLPYADDSFDTSYHFGGINFMPDLKKAISEMTRVVRHGGTVAFGDEGIAPWLKESEYYKMMVENNSLWLADTPLNLLPENANHVNVSWVLENCFYFINFIKDKNFPTVNIDVPHKGKRGGSIRTRYFGEIEGVTEEAKSILAAKAKKKGISMHAWLEKVIRERE